MCEVSDNMWGKWKFRSTC